MSGAAFDYKRAFRDLYVPGQTPVLVDVPPMPFFMVDGEGNPNGNPAFQAAIEVLYGLSFTIKMAKMKGQQAEGYFEYVVPPLEGLWWVEGGGFSFDEKDRWMWTVMIRQPEFVTPAVAERAMEELARKRPGAAVGAARLEVFAERLCVQVMHIGPYSEEPESMRKMERFIEQQGLQSRVGSGGKHHEIYLSDPRRCKPERLRTVLRHPVLWP